VREVENAEERLSIAEVLFNTSLYFEKIGVGNICFNNNIFFYTQNTIHYYNKATVIKTTAKAFAISVGLSSFKGKETVDIAAVRLFSQPKVIKDFTEEIVFGLKQNYSFQNSLLVGNEGGGISFSNNILSLKTYSIIKKKFSEFVFKENSWFFSQEKNQIVEKEKYYYNPSFSFFLFNSFFYVLFKKYRDLHLLN